MERTAQAHKESPERATPTKEKSKSSPQKQITRMAPLLPMKCPTIAKEVQALFNHNLAAGCTQHPGDKGYARKGTRKSTLSDLLMKRSIRISSPKRRHHNTTTQAPPVEAGRDRVPPPRGITRSAISRPSRCGRTMEERTAEGACRGGRRRRHSQEARSFAVHSAQGRLRALPAEILLLQSPDLAPSLARLTIDSDLGASQYVRSSQRPTVTGGWHGNLGIHSLVGFQSATL